MEDHQDASTTDPEQPLTSVAPSLPTEIVISRIRGWPPEDTDVAASCEALLQTKTVRHLTVYCGALTEKQKRMVSTCLSQSSSVPKVVLRGSYQARAPLGPLLRGICENRNMQELYITDVIIDGLTLDSFATFLKSPACSLAKLVIKGCEESACPNENAQRFAEACRVNGSLQDLQIDGDGDLASLFRALVGNSATSLTQNPAAATLALSDPSFDSSSIRFALHESKLELGLTHSSRAEFQRVLDGSRGSSAVKELILRGNLLEHSEVLVLSQIIQGLVSLQSILFEGLHLKPESWAALVQAVQSNTSIQTMAMKPKYGGGESNKELPIAVGRLLESTAHVVHLDVGCCCHADGFPQLANGLKLSRTLRSLTLRNPRPCGGGQMWKILIEEGLCRNASLERLTLKLPCTDEVARPLADYIRKTKSVRTLKLFFCKLEGNEWPMVPNALALHPVLEEVSLSVHLNAANFPHQKKFADELVSVIPKLLKVRTLEASMGGSDMLANASRFCQIALNMSLTEIVHPFTLTTDEEEMEAERAKRQRIEARNKSLSSVDYGVKLPPILWPLMIKMVLRNEHVGPSLVHRLLTVRPEQLDTGEGSEELPRKKARVE